MSKPKPCPFCGAGLFHHHRPTKHYSWYCGTYRYGNERPVQGDACRIHQLEAENARLRKCETCDGLGGVCLPIGTDYFGTEKFGDLEQCPECKGTGVNQWAATVGEIARLKAIVDKLPKTADGVPVVPDDVVFHTGQTIEAGAVAIDPDGEWLVYPQHTDKPWAVKDCYSTRAAAEAAQEKGKD